MKIHYIGTGNVFSKRLSPCIVIDQNILIEIPNGATKALKNAGVDIRKITLCLISHMHADHVFDIPFLILNKYILGGDKMKIVGPRGSSDYIRKLCDIAYPSLNWNKIRSYTIESEIEIAEAVKMIEYPGYLIYAARVEHGEEICYGYSVEDKSKKSFCYTGDTAYCETVERLVKNSFACCVEMNEIQCSRTHMGYEDIIKIYNRNRESKIYAIHTPDDIEKLENIQYPICFPKDDTLIEI